MKTLFNRMAGISQAIKPPIQYFSIGAMVFFGSLGVCVAGEDDGGISFAKGSDSSGYSIRQIHSDGPVPGKYDDTGNLSCPCGTCWNVETYTYSTGKTACETCKSLSYLRMCTPAGWRQTGNEWCSASNRNCR
jgi:hypothetical protein